jgi:glucokinase
MGMRINIKMEKLFIGVDLGGTNIKTGCFDSQMKLLASTSVPTQADLGPEFVADKIVETILQITRQGDTSMDAVQGIGIGAPGPADLAKGIILAAPNLPKFRNVPLRKMIIERTGKPAVLENDANAACYGEYVIGAGRGADDMVFLTLGTGIGGGIITNSQLVHGFGDNAAELGHVIIELDGRLCGCGQRGCVEAYASANSTVKRAVEAIEAGKPSSLAAIYRSTGQVTAKDIYQQLAAGDALAKEITEGTAKALGVLCVSLLHVTGPRRIVFAGGMIAAGDLLLSRIRHYFNQYIWPLKPESLEICFATLGEQAGMVGAAALAKTISH